MFREPRVNRGRLRHCNGLQTPKATGRQTGKAGARFEARSQDTGLAVLVAVPIPGPASPSKRRMRPVSRAVFEGVVECLYSPSCRGLKVFLFTATAFKTAARQLIKIFGFRTGLSSNNPFRHWAEPFERSVQCKKIIFR